MTLKRYLRGLLSAALVWIGTSAARSADVEVSGYLYGEHNWTAGNVYVLTGFTYVMGGAVLVMVLAWLLQKRMQRPVFATSFSLPDRSDITPRLVGGSALFGIGWGIAGLCPGPGFAALAIAPASAAIFVVAMLAGMLLVRLVEGQ